MSKEVRGGVEFEERSEGNTFFGKRWSLEQVGSVSALLSELDSRCGVYRLTFCDGSRYVGQSLDVAKRVSQHRRRWEDISDLEFFPTEIEELNEAEELLLRTTERDHDVRNILLANRPSRTVETKFEAEHQTSLKLPWDRNARGRLAGDTDDQRWKRFEKLAESPFYPSARLLAGWYLSEVVPSPKITQGKLWTVSALPSTGKTEGYYRIFTLNVGNLETLVAQVIRDGNKWRCYFRLNTANPSSDLQSFIRRQSKMELVNDPYRLTSVVSLIMSEHDALELTEKTESWWRNELLDRAYELNVRLMRQGGGLFRKSHNSYLAQDLIFAAATFAK